MTTKSGIITSNLVESVDYMINVRPATIADASEILKIYAPYITGTTITFEYDVPTVAEFKDRIATTLENYPYLVAETEDGKIVGFAYAHRYKERPAYNWSAEVSIYVDNEIRGLGIGKVLSLALEELLAKQNVVNLCACITGKNHNSVLFHEKMGYELVGTFEDFGFKFGEWYDVIWLQKRIYQGEHPRDFIPYSQLPK